VLAEIVRFERGAVRWTLAQLAALEGRAARRAAAVVTPSRYAADTVARLYGVPPARIEVIPFGIDLAGWDAAVRGMAPPEPAAPTVLCVARLYPRKGIDLLLEAFAQVVRKVPDARLEIVGAGLLDRWLTAAIAAHPARERIAWHGDQPPDALPAFYRRASVFCLPSRHETFGFAFLEAMASGLPVVALHTTAVPEMVRDGETGRLARREDPAELAALLAQLLRDPAEAQSLGAAGRARAAGYSWRFTAQFLQELFRKIT
jgi:glycosyltransferase involved in cell wall biosynthesis